MPDASEPEAAAAVRPPPVAPWPHTVYLLAVLGLWAVYGAMRSVVAPSVTPHLVSYASSIVMQSLLVGSAIAGLYHRRQFLSDALGGFDRRRLMGDVGIGLLVYIGGLILILVMHYSLKTTALSASYRHDVVHARMPTTVAEMTLWLGVSLAAGLGEEFIFRGYLQQQFTRWFRSIPIAVILSAATFGSLHLYQGTAAAIQIAGLGALYSLVAIKTGNLRSVIFAHFLQDALTGLFYYVKYH